MVVFLVVVEFLVVVVVFGVGNVEVSAGVIGDVSICFVQNLPLCADCICRVPYV